MTYTAERARDDGSRTSKSRVTWAGVLPIVRRSWKWSKMKRIGACRESVVCPDCNGKCLNPSRSP